MPHGSVEACPETVCRSVRNGGKRAYLVARSARQGVPSSTKGDPTECRGVPGKLVPVVARGSCEGKSECEAVCPYDVFEVRRIEDADYRGLSFISKLKVRAHGMDSSYVIHPDACHACSLCVSACPEKAITLARA